MFIYNHPPLFKENRLLYKKISDSVKEKTTYEIVETLDKNSLDKIISGEFLNKRTSKKAQSLLNFAEYLYRKYPPKEKQKKLYAFKGLLQKKTKELLSGFVSKKLEGKLMSDTLKTNVIRDTSSQISKLDQEIHQNIVVKVKESLTQYDTDKNGFIDFREHRSVDKDYYGPPNLKFYNFHRSAFNSLVNKFDNNPKLKNKLPETWKEIYNSLKQANGDWGNLDEADQEKILLYVFRNKADLTKDIDKFLEETPDGKKINNNSIFRIIALIRTEARTQIEHYIQNTPDGEPSLDIIYDRINSIKQKKEYTTFSSFMFDETIAGGTYSLMAALGTSGATINTISNLDNNAFLQNPYVYTNLAIAGAGAALLYFKGAKNAITHFEETSDVNIKADNATKILTRYGMIDWMRNKQGAHETRFFFNQYTSKEREKISDYINQNTSLPVTTLSKLLDYKPSILAKKLDTAIPEDIELSKKRYRLYKTLIENNITESDDGSAFTKLFDNITIDKRRELLESVAREGLNENEIITVSKILKSRINIPERLNQVLITSTKKIDFIDNIFKDIKWFNGNKKAEILYSISIKDKEDVQIKCLNELVRARDISNKKTRDTIDKIIKNTKYINVVTEAKNILQKEYEVSFDTKVAEITAALSKKDFDRLKTIIQKTPNIKLNILPLLHNLISDPKYNKTLIIKSILHIKDKSSLDTILRIINTPDYKGTIKEEIKTYLKAIYLKTPNTEVYTNTLIIKLIRSYESETDTAKKTELKSLISMLTDKPLKDIKRRNILLKNKIIEIYGDQAKNLLYKPEYDTPSSISDTLKQNNSLFKILNSLKTHTINESGELIKIDTLSFLKLKTQKQSLINRILKLPNGEKLELIYKDLFILKDNIDDIKKDISILHNIVDQLEYSVISYKDKRWRITRRISGKELEGLSKTNIEVFKTNSKKIGKLFKAYKEIETKLDSDLIAKADEGLKEKLSTTRDKLRAQITENLNILDSIFVHNNTEFINNFNKSTDFTSIEKIQILQFLGTKIKYLSPGLRKEVYNIYINNLSSYDDIKEACITALICNKENFDKKDISTEISNILKKCPSISLKKQCINYLLTEPKGINYNILLDISYPYVLRDYTMHQLIKLGIDNTEFKDILFNLSIRSFEKTEYRKNAIIKLYIFKDKDRLKKISLHITDNSRLKNFVASLIKKL